MLVYKDIFTGDELMSNVFQSEMDYDDVIMKVKSAYKTKDNIGNVDIGCGSAFGTGDDDADQGGDNPTGEEKVIDVVFNHNLVPINMSQKDYMAYAKEFCKQMKELLKDNPERLEIFQKGATNFIKFVVQHFKDFEFYTGSSEDSEGMKGSIVHSYWEDETAAGPVLYFFKDALKEEKC